MKGKEMGVANCPICGKFARSNSYKGYDGTWNQIWITTFCKDCGEQTVTVV